MYMYITYGTVDYLEKMASKNLQENLILMANSDRGILFHESQSSSIFQSPKTYEIIAQYGTFQGAGIAVLNNIPVSDEGRPVFELHFKESVHLVENAIGMIGYRVLRPLTNDIYVILTLWDSEISYKSWKGSNQKQMSGKKESLFEGIDHKSIYPQPSYITTFYPVEE